MEENKVEKTGEFLNTAKDFLWKNMDALVLTGQLLLVAVVCIAGIKKDLPTADPGRKKRRKKRK